MFFGKSDKTINEDDRPVTPGEKADKAVIILEIVDDNVRHALMLRAYFCRAAYHDDVKTHFDQSRAAPGYNQVVDSLYFELIMTLVRLYDDLPEDKHAQNVASLPELMALLAQAEVVGEFQARSEKLKYPKGEFEKELQSYDTDFLMKLRANATNSAQAETSQIFALIGEFNKLKGSHLIARLRTIRHELFAHTAIERTRNNPPHYGDAEELLDKTTRFVAQLNSAVRSLHCTYEEHIQTCQEQADYFWTYVVGKNTEKTIRESVVRQED